MTRGIVITSFGSRDKQRRGLLANIAKVTDLPVTICDESKFAPDKKTHDRWGVRTSNKAKVWAAMEGPYDSVCILDDDMRIVHPSWTEGFDLAEKFGFCLPQSPRMYVHVSAAKGADVPHAAKQELGRYPQYATECNTSPMFVCRGDYRAERWVRQYERELLERPCRGTSTLWKAAWKCGYHPYILSALWCVCGDHAAQQHCGGGRTPLDPIMLHVGHGGVMRWFETDKRFARYR